MEPVEVTVYVSGRFCDGCDVGDDRRRVLPGGARLGGDEAPFVGGEDGASADIAPRVTGVGGDVEFTRVGVERLGGRVRGGVVLKEAS
jgi:hypothetical protein